MKQAILIIAHENIPHLLKIIECFDSDFYFFIHIDKSYKIDQKEYRSLEANPQVKVIIQKYRIHWGGFRIVKSILLLCESALKYEDVGYLHLISGADFPAKSCKYFKVFFEKNATKQFMDYFTLPTPNWSEGGLNRIRFYYFTDWINIQNLRGSNLINKSLKYQKKFHIKRSFSFKNLPLYGGSNWWSLNRECVKYVLNYTKENYAFFRRFRFTLIPDEIYFQSIIMHSSYAFSVVNDNLRYIDWTCRNGKTPAYLDITDYDKIVSSHNVFVRKIEYPTSNLLLGKLEKIVF